MRIIKNTVSIYVFMQSLFVILYLFTQCQSKPSSSQVQSSPAQNPCAKELDKQNNYLNSETYSEKFRFEQYPSVFNKNFRPQFLDINSSQYSRKFRSRIDEELKKTPVNFDGRYSFIAVGMSGWGNQYWIIDRKTGKAFEFPYHAVSIEFREQSNLIILNPKEKIRELLSQSGGTDCYFINQEKVSDLRPFYLKWENSNLILLAPGIIKPPVNLFWTEFFSDIPDGTPEALAYFINEIKKGMIFELGKVLPLEEYTGFNLIKTYPALLPEDFTGVRTSFGEYKITNRKLAFEGNLPSNAATMNVNSWQQFLINLSTRLGIEPNSKREIDQIIQFILNRKKSFIK
jgi:hypothetical protein